MNARSDYAPVVIPTLCRFEHFKRCVESLSKCTGAERTELYIGLDYPSKDSHWDGYNRICDFIPSVTGFKSVIVIKRDKNYGAVLNAKELLLEVKKKYDCYIFSEDDNEFAPNFLEYVNQGLKKYKNHPDVLAICGYAEPKGSYESLQSYPYNAYPIIGYNAWGVGKWFDKIPQLYSDSEIIYNIRNVIKCIALSHGVAMFRIMKRMRSNATSDLQWRIYCAFNHKYCIFPRVSKVKNWGFDGSGENSAKLESYTKMPLDTSASFTFDEFEIRDYPEILKLQKEKCIKWKIDI